MKKQLAILGILFILFTSLAFAQDATPQSTKTDTKTTTIIHVKRGQALSYNDVTAIAEISSARNEKGDPVQLDATKTYSIASYTNATVSIMPPDGAAGDVITLDLKVLKGESNKKVIQNEIIKNK